MQDMQDMQNTPTTEATARTMGNIITSPAGTPIT